ncbi:MAG: cytochrome d ubiquinol oxidase subunit II [Steroidobacter sp.]
MNGVETLGLTGQSLWLPVIFLLLISIAVLAYVILDGYDLGVGVLLRHANEQQQDIMIASIGPFWDANETWLVLGVGLLLVAFPTANGVILTSLYLPVAMMLCGLILRGVAFDFRIKAHAHHKPLWNRAFCFGSLLAAFAQGMMLGGLITGFSDGGVQILFSTFVGLCLASAYTLIGACWLIMKTEGELQACSIRWAQHALWLAVCGIVAVSLATPIVSSRIFEKWFSLPNILLLIPIPMLTAGLFIMAAIFLRRLAHDAAASNQRGLDRWCWAPFVCVVVIFILSFIGLGYSLFPYLVIDRITIWQAASAPESLMVILIGALIVLPAIIGYTIFAYRVFWGKATDLHYG